MDPVEPRRERRVDLGHAGVPEVEGDLAHGDEVVQVRGVDLPVLPVAVQQRVPERRVLLLVPQLPQGDGELVQAGAGAAVVEVDQLDLAALEQRVAEVQVGVDEPDVVDVRLRSPIRAATDSKRARTSAGRSAQQPAADVSP